MRAIQVSKPRGAPSRNGVVAAMTFGLTAVVLAGQPVAVATAAEPAPSATAHRVAKRISHEALLPPNGPEGRPLPLVSHWNMGSYGRGWTPQYQMELLDEGHYILPWLGWPRGNPDADPKAAGRFNDYYGELLAWCRALRLPV